MPRPVIVAVTLVSAVVLLLGAVRLVRNPMDIRRESLEARLEAELRRHNRDEPEAIVTRPDPVPRIMANTSLWRPVIPAPVTRREPPNLSGMANGLEFSRRQSGDLILMNSEREGRGWVGVGDVVHGLTIRTIAPAQVTLELAYEGETYTINLPRR